MENGKVCIFIKEVDTTNGVMYVKGGGQWWILLVLFFLWDFMSNLPKSKRFDLIDKFNDTSRYLDDIFTIDNPEFAEYIPDIYPRKLQLNKANTSDKETSFLDLNIKVVGSNIHTSVYDKRDDFGFPIVNFPWLSGDVPRLPSYFAVSSTC